MKSFKQFIKEQASESDTDDEMVRADYDLWNDVFMGKDTNQEAKQVSDFLWQASRGGVEKDATRYSSNPNVIVPYRAGEVVGGKPGFEKVKPVSAMDIDKTFETDTQRKKNLAADEQEKIDSMKSFSKDQGLEGMSQEDIQSVYDLYQKDKEEE